MNAYPGTNEELVRKYLEPVLEGLYSPEEWSDETEVAHRRTIYKWMRSLEAGEEINLRAKMKRKLLSYLGWDPLDVLPYQDDGGSVSEEG